MAKKDHIRASSSSNAETDRHDGITDKLAALCSTTILRLARAGKD
jgi:hypothetical protein